MLILPIEIRDTKSADSRCVVIVPSFSTNFKSRRIEEIRYVILRRGARGRVEERSHFESARPSERQDRGFAKEGGGVITFANDGDDYQSAVSREASVRLRESRSIPRNVRYVPRPWLFVFDRNKHRVFESDVGGREE